MVPLGETIDFDLSCARCAYNLRTLSRRGVCPECGHSVDSSRRSDVIRNAELGALRLLGIDWLERVRRGVTLALIAWLAGMPTAVYLLVNVSPSTDFVVGVSYLLPFVGPFVISAWAAWHLATPRDAAGRFVARGIRALIVAGVAAVGLVYVNDRFVAYYRLPFREAIPESIYSALAAAGKVACVAWPIATAYTLARVAQLAFKARRYVLGVLFATLGAAATFVTAVLVLGLIAAVPPESAGFAPFLIGPTGAWPSIWGTFALIALPFSGRGGPDVLPRLLMCLGIFLALAVGPAMAWLRLRETLARAVELGTMDDSPRRRA